MKASSQSMNALFSGAHQYLIPPYQREYQWGVERWQNFWTDIGLAVQEDATKHFMGLVLFDKVTAAGVGDAQEMMVIDGQQRIVTTLLATAAARDHWLDLRGEPRLELDPIFKIPLFPREKERFRLQEADRESFNMVAQGNWRDWYRNATSQKKLRASRILQAYTFFRLCMWLGKPSFEMTDLELPVYRRGQEGLQAEDVWISRNLQPANDETVIPENLVSGALHNFEFLQVNLEASDEAAATIFDSLNAHQSPLEQWDFVRNMIFIRLSREQGHRLFTEEWDAVQSALQKVTWENKRAEARDAFLYDYLITTGEAKHEGSINQSRTANQLMNRINRLVPLSNPESAIETFVRDDLLFAARRWPVAVGFDKAPIGRSRPFSPEILDSVATCTQLSSGPPFPVVLNILQALDRSDISQVEALAELRALETLLVRMCLARQPFSPLRAATQKLVAKMMDEGSRIGFDVVLQDEYREGRLVPTDHKIRESVKSTDYYKNKASGRQIAAILRGIERELAGNSSHPLTYGADKDDWTVEHILPQSAFNNRAPAWRESLPSRDADRGKLLDMIQRLGNLTLLTNRANSYLRNKGFDSKVAVFRGSDPACPMPHLSINNSVISKPKWTARAINERNGLFADLILRRWPAP